MSMNRICLMGRIGRDLELKKNEQRRIRCVVPSCR